MTAKTKRSAPPETLDAVAQAAGRAAPPPITDGKVLDSGKRPTPIHLDTFLAECGVDRTYWDVERWIANRWEVGAKVDDALVTEPLYQIKVWLRPAKGTGAVHLLWRDFLADLRRRAPASPRLPTRLPAQRSYLLELAPVDAHFGKLAWAAETGSSYDLKWAKEAWRDAIEDLSRKAMGFPISDIALVISNDGLHFDNFVQTTTGGTFQDADTRYAKMFTTYWQECRWAVDALKSRAPVRVIVVPGNHDRQSAFAIGSVLEAWYHKDRRVVVDNAPKLRKYLRYGVTLLGFTHGSEEKHADLPLIMASEARDEWGATQHHEWHTGHFHKAKETRFTAADSFGGVRVRILPSLSGHDAWHYKKGYNVERRAAEAYLFHRDTGYAGHFSSNVLPTEAV